MPLYNDRFLEMNATEYTNETFLATLSVWVQTRKHRSKFYCLGDFFQCEVWIHPTIKSHYTCKILRLL